MHLHGTAALENATALSVAPPPVPPPDPVSPTTSAYPSYFPASASTTNVSGTSPTGGTTHHQRRQSSPTQSTAPSAFPPSPAWAPVPPMPPMPLPSILTATPRTLSRLRALLSSWHFEPYLLSPPETLLCVQLVFEALLSGLKLRFCDPDDAAPAPVPASASASASTPPSRPKKIITMEGQMIPFLTDLMRLYRRENRYHSFVHALDVLQAVYTFLELQGRTESIAVAFLGRGGDGDGDGAGERDGLEYGSHHRGGPGSSARGRTAKDTPPSPIALLSDDDLFLLCLAAIGHDVGHPGNSNAFLVRFLFFFFSISLSSFFFSLVLWAFDSFQLCTV